MERFILDPSGAHGSQPGVLNFGLFVTFSFEKRRHVNHVWIRPVSRWGPSGPVIKQWWTDEPMPEKVYTVLTDYVRSMLDEHIYTTYGMQKEFPD